MIICILEMVFYRMAENFNLIPEFIQLLRSHYFGRNTFFKLK
jgi:hypothetical protein